MVFHKSLWVNDWHNCIVHLFSNIHRITQYRNITESSDEEIKWIKLYGRRLKDSVDFTIQFIFI